MLYTPARADLYDALDLLVERTLLFVEKLEHRLLPVEYNNTVYTEQLVAWQQVVTRGMNNIYHIAVVDTKA